jgi:dTDP-4-amino-4,6-dideoxygalactose transaminase
MRIGRSLPPAAAPIGWRELAAGFGGLLQGPKALDRFQSELKAYFGVRHCFLVNSGKAALTLVLLALKKLFPDRVEVIIPAFTCYSVPSSVVRAGLRIRLCDLGRDSLDLDPAQLSGMLSGAGIKRPLAVVPTHLYGIPSDVPRVRRLIPDGAVTIVEDAAQAMGETLEGRKLGTLGDVAFLSLGRGKAFSTVEGGVILTDRDDIAAALGAHMSSLPGYGFWGLLRLISKALGLMAFIHPLLFWMPRALPFLRLGETLFDREFPILRMSAFQAGLALNWDERLQGMRNARKANTVRWLEILEDLGGRGSWIAPSQLLGLVRLPIRIRDAVRRDALLRESARSGAGIASVYPESINRLDELKGEIPVQGCPVAEHCARELVTLPTHGYLTQKDVALIRRLLGRAFGVAGHPSTGRTAAVEGSHTQSGINHS